MGKLNKKRQQGLSDQMQAMNLRDRKLKIRPNQQQIFIEDLGDQEQVQEQNKLENKSRPKNNEAEKKYLAWCKPRRLIFYFHAYTLTTFYLFKNNIKSRQGQIEDQQQDSVQKEQIYEFIKYGKESLKETDIQKLYEQAIQYIQKDNFPTLQKILDEKKPINFKEEYTGQYTPNSLQNGFHEYRKKKIETQKIKQKQNERFKIKVEVLKAFIVSFLKTNKLLNKKMLGYLHKYWNFIQELVQKQKYQIDMPIQQTGIERNQQFVEEQFAEMNLMSQQQMMQDQEFQQCKQIKELKVDMLEDFNVARQNNEAFKQIHMIQEEINMVQEQNQKKVQKKEDHQNIDIKVNRIQNIENIDHLFSLQSQNEFLHHQEQDQIYQDDQDLSQRGQEQDDDLVNKPFNFSGSNKINHKRAVKGRNEKTKTIQKKETKKQTKKQKGKEKKAQKKKKIKVQDQSPANNKSKTKKGRINSNPPRTRNRVQIDIVLQEMNADSACCAFNLANYIWHVFNDVHQELYQLINE